MIMKTYFSIQMDGWTTNIYWLWMLYIQKLKSLDYQQHTNVIIGSIHRYLNNCLQLVFINDNHWILIKIHVFAPSLHYTTYNSNTLMIRRLPNDTIQLLTSIINVENLCQATNKWFMLWNFHNNICSQYIAFGINF
jgi:hypothetical protein